MIKLLIEIVYNFNLKVHCSFNNLNWKSMKVEISLLPNSIFLCNFSFQRKNRLGIVVDIFLYFKILVNHDVR